MVLFFIEIAFTRGENALSKATPVAPPVPQVFTHHHIVKLTQVAPWWALIPSFDHTAHLPEQRLVTGPVLLGACIAVLQYVPLG
jgi:hypothetical protein